jgi:hypothetical protein
LKKLWGEKAIFAVPKKNASPSPADMCLGRQKVNRSKYATERFG